MRAVLTFARGWNALAAARSLGRRGVEIIAGDEYPFAAAMLSRYTKATFRYPNPDRDPDGFLDRLEEVVREHRPASGPYALLCFHKETYLIAEHRRRFEGLISFALPAPEQIEQVHDKGKLAELCRRLGIPIPRTEVVRSREEAREVARDFPYPAFVKVRKSAAAVGVRRAQSPVELLRAFDELVERFRLGPQELPILQEGVGGSDYCSTFLFDRGRPCTSMTYRNLRAWPVRRGAGVLRESVRATRLEDIGRQLLSKLGWHGVAEIDFRWDGRSEPKLIEVNPRFWGGLPQSIASGWDYPWLVFCLASSGRVPPLEEVRLGAKTETPVMALLATLHEVVRDEARTERLRQAFRQFRSEFVRGGRGRAVRNLVGRVRAAVDLRGRLRLLRRLLEDHRGTVSDIFSKDDPKPALAVLFPLVVFLKHGRISTELLVEGQPRTKRPETREP